MRLEEVGRLLGIKVTGKKCMGMEGVISEGAEILQEQGDQNVHDIGIIGAGTRVEHYEIAGYVTAISLAQRMGLSEVVDLLTESLNEEESADEKLRDIAASLLEKAPTGEHIATMTAGGTKSS